jgi:hypothetical protein
MNTITLVANSIRSQEDCPLISADLITKNICCITGDLTDCIPKKLVIKDTFTNRDLLKAPQSEYCSVDAYIVLSYKWQRFSSWLCNGKEFQRLTKTDFKHLILNGVPYDTWAIYITTSYKKHGALVAKINNTPFGIWRFEMQDVDCRDNEKVKEWYDKLLYIHKLGIPRSVLENLNAGMKLINAVGILEWHKFTTWANDKYRSPLYGLLCYLLPSLGELKYGKD